MSALGMIRTLNQLGGPLAQDLTAPLLGRRAITPHPGRLPEWERPAAESAERITFRFGLSGLRWGKAGPVALMLHGWDGRPTQFGALVAPLLAAGFQVIALDAPGHGNSPRQRSTLMEFVLALQEAAVEIPNLELAIGHSLGATATALALSRGLPARRAVLIAPMTRVEAGLYGFASTLGLQGAAAAKMVGVIEQANGIAARDLDPTAQAEAFDIPALVVHDRHDRMVPFEDGARLARAWSGAELMETEGLGHWRVLASPVVAARIAAFVVPGATLLH